MINTRVSFMRPYENCDGFSIVRDNPDGGDPLTLAVLERVHRPEELHELCALANRAIEAHSSPSSELARGNTSSPVHTNEGQT